MFEPLPPGQVDIVVDPVALNVVEPPVVGGRTATVEADEQLCDLLAIGDDSRHRPVAVHISQWSHAFVLVNVY